MNEPHQNAKREHLQKIAHRWHRAGGIPAVVLNCHGYIPIYQGRRRYLGGKEGEED